MTRRFTKTTLAPFQVLEMLDEATAWIDGATAWRSKAEHELALEFRDRMAAAIDAKNYEAAEAWGRYFDTLRWIEARERAVMPLARIGKHYENRLPMPGERVSIYTPKKTASDRKARDQRIRQAHLDGRTNADIARREGVNIRTVQRVISAA